MQKTKLLQLTLISIAESFSLKDHEEAQVKITNCNYIVKNYIKNWSYSLEYNFFLNKNFIQFKF